MICQGPVSGSEKTRVMFQRAAQKRPPSVNIPTVSPKMFFFSRENDGVLRLVASKGDQQA